jgi:hypothetical protein
MKSHGGFTVAPAPGRLSRGRPARGTAEMPCAQPRIAATAPGNDLVSNPR